MNFLKLIQKNSISDLDLQQNSFNYLTKLTDDPNNGSWYPADYVPFCLRIQTYSINDVLV